MSLDSDRIHVLRIISRLNIGGPARHVVILNSGLDRAAFRSKLVTGVVREYEGDMSYLVGEKDIDICILPGLAREVGVLDDVRSFRELFRLIRASRPDIVHTHASKAGALGRIAAIVAGVPVVVHTFHGHVFKGYFGRLVTRFILTVERFLARYTSAIVAICESQKDELVQQFRIAPSSKIEVIPLGLELKPLLTAGRNTGTLRNRLGLACDVPLVATSGRLVPIKDIPNFLNAAKIVLDKMPDVHFALIGDGELRPVLQELASSLGICHAVEFTGWIEDMTSVYPDVDILVQSSINEGTPVSVIEAMASGCCVVATRAGGTVDVVKDGENGLLVPVGDTQALAGAILRVVKERELRSALAAKGRKDAERYRSERLIADMEDLYLRLLNGKASDTS